MMARAEDKVMRMVEGELQKNPSIKVDELYEKARAAHPKMEELNLRQFNARYPLQIKRRQAREQAPAAGSAAVPRASATRRRRARQANRDAVREVFLAFASAMAAAEERKDLVQVLASVDRYVDQVMKAGGGR